MQTAPCPAALPYASLPGTWHVQGHGQPVVILPGAQVRWHIWDAILHHWSPHCQLLLPDCATAADTARLRSTVTGLGTHPQPLYLMGLHEGAAQACELAAQLPGLSGLVLLYDQRHGAGRSGATPDADTLPVARHKLPSHIPILTVWLSAPGQTDPSDAALAQAQNHSLYEWMVLPATASAHTVAQFIHSWLQSHA